VVYNSSATQAVTAKDYGNLTFSSTGARTLSGTIGVLGSFTPGSNSITYGTSTVNFNGTGAQSVPAIDYYNLTISTGHTTNAITFASGTIGIFNTFSPNTGNTNYQTSGNTVDFKNSGSQTIPIFNKYNNLSNSGNGSRTLASGIIKVDNVYTPTTGSVSVGSSTLDFSGSASQTIPASSFYNITNSGSGARTLASSGTIYITGPTFTGNSGTWTITGSTVDFDYSGTATISALSTGANPSYNHVILSTPFTIYFSNNIIIAGNLTFNNTLTAGFATLAAATTLTINGNYIQSQGTFNLAEQDYTSTLNVGGNLSLTGSDYTSALNMSTVNSTAILNITGNCTIGGGSSTATLNMCKSSSASAGSATVTVTGNTTVSGSFGALKMESNSNASSSSIAVFQTTDFTVTGSSSSAVDFGTGTLTGNEFRVKGNFSKSGSGTFGTSGSTAATGFVFNKVGTQTFSYSGANSNYTSYNVAENSTLQMLTDLRLGTSSSPASTFEVYGTLDCGSIAAAIAGQSSSSFTIYSGGMLKTANTNGIYSGTIGSISSSVPTRTFANGASYTFNGSTAQTANFPNTTMNTLIINNLAASDANATVTLNAPITVNSLLTLTDGYLVTTPTNILTMASGSSSSGVSSSSYINGPMIKTGATGFEFPIGKGNGTQLGRVKISDLSATESFTAEFFNTAYADTASMAESSSPLGSVSGQVYWNLNRAATANAKVSLYWEDAAAFGVQTCSASSLRIAHWNGTAWENNNPVVSITGSCGGSNSGTIESSSRVTSFSPFTFGSEAVALPVELFRFEGEFVNNYNRIIWETASELNNDYFKVERSSDGFNFRSINQTKGSGISTELIAYEFLDTTFEPTINYYRLRQYDFDGREKLSDIFSIDNRRSRDNENDPVISIYNLLGQSVNENYSGVIITRHKSGRTLKTFQK
jgi:hypothetical protein